MNVLADTQRAALASQQWAVNNGQYVEPSLAVGEMLAAFDTLGSQQWEDINGQYDDGVCMQSLAGYE